MSQHDIIVIGASEGGIEALQALVASVPGDIKAAVFVCVHIPPFLTSNLPRVISNSCTGCLPAIHPRDGELVEQGRIYVAPPDYHLLVEDNHIHLWRGPKENQLRPAINTLFRSAAVAYRERVIGVVLSGTLDDGCTGLWWIKHFGGIAVVQDPSDARFPEMPRNALEHVKADCVVRVSEMGSVLTDLVNGRSALPCEEP